MNTPNLETNRLLLAPLSLDDAPDIQHHFPHWEVVQHLSTKVPWPYPEDGALTFLRDSVLPGMEDGSQLSWGIRLKTCPDEVVGILSYNRLSDGIDSRGFWLAKHLQGHGYMTEVVTCFQDFLFFELGVDSIYVGNAKGNRRSRRVKEKTGARFLDEIEMEHLDGQTVAERWIVTREAWAALRGRSES